LSGITFGLYDAQTAFKHVEEIQSFTAGLLSGTLDDQEREKQTEQIKQAKQAKIEEANADYAMKDRSSVDAILQKQQSGEELSAREKAKLNMYEKDENGNLKVDQHGNYIISERGQDAYVKELSQPVRNTLLFSTEELRERNKDAKNLRRKTTKAAMVTPHQIQNFVVSQSDVSPFLQANLNNIKRAIASGDKQKLKNLRSELNRTTLIYMKAIDNDWGNILVSKYGDDRFTPKNKSIPESVLEKWVDQQYKVNVMITAAEPEIDAMIAAEKANMATDMALATRLAEEAMHNDKHRNNTKWWNARR
jgi:hypothetical protein